MTAYLLTIVITMASWWPSIGATVQEAAGTAMQPSPTYRAQTYDGNWWLAADEKEQLGFLEGASDCLVWTVHDLNFSETSSQVAPRINKYYQDHPTQRSLNVLEVWQRTEPKAPQPKAPTGGETWKNPHWYLNGGWWQQSSRDEQLGFVEGYLWCIRIKVKPQRQSYLQPADYYAGKISEYVKSHDHAVDEAIADILARYQARTSKARQ
jgi:hypothetical protein